jgi:hypothetical protein
VLSVGGVRLRVIKAVQSFRQCAFGADNLSDFDVFERIREAKMLIGFQDSIWFAKPGFRIDLHCL